MIMAAATKWKIALSFALSKRIRTLLGILMIAAFEKSHICLKQQQTPKTYILLIHICPYAQHWATLCLYESLYCYIVELI